MLLDHRLRDPYESHGTPPKGEIHLCKNCRFDTPHWDKCTETAGLVQRYVERLFDWRDFDWRERNEEARDKGCSPFAHPASRAFAESLGTYPGATSTGSQGHRS